ncbi:MAG: sigma-70 family RNA polymerase sigma factor [Bacteroidales bacterium]|nr:sigma-70 family RNA polymerase sigma factor [Bacteroidales bacterium]
MSEVRFLDYSVHANLVEECRKGNRKAQFTIYNQYSKAMFSLAYRMMNNREEAEDMLQESFVECFRNLESFRFQATFGAWLKRIVINRCINELRRRKTDFTSFDTLPVDLPDEAPEEIYDTARIFRAIELLPDGYRIIFTLHLLEGYDHNEIAQILGISESTSKSQYSRAKVKLRNLLLKK